MIFVKSVLAGIAGMIATTFLAVMGLILYISTKFRELPEGTAVGWDPMSFARQSAILWLVLAAAFAAGFVWEWKRVKAKASTRVQH